jgi:hypothetical protein
MTEPSLAVQTAIRSQLVGASSVTTLVDAASIFDRTTRPERLPCIIVGDGQTVNVSKSYPRRHVRVYSDLHLWTEENGLALVKALAGAVYGALANIIPILTDCRCLDCEISEAKFIRDPAGKHGHAVVTFQALVEIPL